MPYTVPGVSKNLLTQLLGYEQVLDNIPGSALTIARNSYRAKLEGALGMALDQALVSGPGTNLPALLTAQELETLPDVLVGTAENAAVLQHYDSNTNEMMEPIDPVVKKLVAARPVNVGGGAGSWCETWVPAKDPVPYQ